MQRILTTVEETAKLAKLAVIESDDESLRKESVRLLALGFVLSEIAEMRCDDDEAVNNKNNNRNNQPKKSHGNTRLPYGLCKREGIDTTGMSPREAWEALAGRGISAREEYKKLKGGGSPKVDIATARANRTSKRQEFKNRAGQLGQNYKDAERKLRYIKDDIRLGELTVKQCKSDYGVDNVEDLNKLKSNFSKQYDNNRERLAEIKNQIMQGDRSNEEEYYKLYEENNKLETRIRRADRYISDIEKYNQDKQKAKERKQKYDEALKEYSDFWKEAEESNEEYYKAIREQFPTVDSCQTPQDVSEYMLATGAFDAVDKPICAIERRFFRDKGYTRIECEPIDLNGCDMDSAKAVARVNDLMLEKIPAFKECLTGIDASGDGCGENTYACCWGYTSGIVLNPKYFGNMKALEESFSKTLVDNYDEDGEHVWGSKKGSYSWHPKGLGADSIYAHEASHAMNNWITYKMTGKTSVKASEEFANEVIKAVGKKFKTNKKEAWKKISRYAKKNESEFYAEAMALYICGDGSNEVANFVGEYTLNKLKEMGV